ncbi:hypothetical protein EHS13_29985 [Paenibacillus psychroresistens]|uniref:receptor protein-tyrosine kinase n=1 Tax=Paenibacillus psychroresistens TaxID=1778678 RepID=A0A6B8RSC6_9BACL|nr:glycine rich domain-containing protein [Paenibacillus psychroresistens]QGQ98807.1 hypothetical protein EHS13_29985 [Paenibacillus psychroresistens]
MRKHLSRLLIVLILISMCYPYAGDINVASGDEIIVDDSVKDLFKVSNDTGDWTSKVKSKEGSGVVYRTVSWIVRREAKSCDRSKDSTPRTQTSGECTALKVAPDESKDDYVEFKMCKTGESVPTATPKPTDTIDDITGCDGNQKEIKREKGNDGAWYVTNEFTIKADRASSKIERTKNLKNIKEGARVYLSAIFQVVDKPNSYRTTRYYTLQAIRDAVGGLPNGFSKQARIDLRDYYDRPVTFYSEKTITLTPSFKLEVEYRHIGDGAILASPSPKQIPDANTFYNPALITMKMKSDLIKPTLDYGGKHYVLACSYQYQNIDKPKAPEAYDCKNLPGDYPNFLRDKNTIERNPPMALGGEVVTLIYKDPGCDCIASPRIDDQPNINGEIFQSKIGKSVSISPNFTDSAPQLDDWKDYLGGYTDFRIKITPTRADIPGGNNTGAVPIWKPTKYTAGQWVATTKAEILAWMGGATGPLYTDDLSNYPIPAPGKVGFKYGIKVELESSKAGLPTAIKTCFDNNGSAGGSTLIPINFFRKDPSTITYTSTPSYWSEIKDTSPGNETFEAMAGIPSTRSLYFASGGSEYIVDVELKYTPGVTSTRKYQSIFPAIESEFIDGDKAKDYTVPTAPGANGGSNYTINAHNGGTVYATWTGTTSMKTSRTWSDHQANGADSWDDKAYDDAKKQADDYVTALNKHTISHKAASDSVDRTFKNWGASITANSNTHPESTVSIGHKEEAEVKGSCGTAPPAIDPNNCIIKNKIDYQATTGSSATNGQYTITVTGHIPAQVIDGPSSVYTMPAVQDTWTQTVKYDYMKIKMAKVWKLDQASVTGMTEITGQKEFKATVVAGDPNIFQNIAATDTSQAGRLRYSRDTIQHDSVVYNETGRTNKDDGHGCNDYGTCAPGQMNASWAKGIRYTNTSYSNVEDYEVIHSSSTDKTTTEYAQFKARREALGNVTVVSDMLILQTSSGDQSIMYFQKPSATKEAQQNYPDVNSTEAEMWDTNIKSFANQSKDAINIGSYNGRYYDTSNKYSKRTYSDVATIFDTMPAGLNRPARVGSAMLLDKTSIDMIDTLPNGEYNTGTSKVFYKNVLDYDLDGTGIDRYPITQNSNFDDAVGVEFASSYSPSHSKVNNIVIHDPVSSEKAMVMSLDDSFDQRTAASANLGGNVIADVVEYEKVLNPAWRPNLLANGDAESIGSNGAINGWSTWTATPGSKVTFTKRQGDEWVQSGLTTFEINTDPRTSGVDYSGSYYKSVTAIPNTHYTFTGLLSCHRCEGFFRVEDMDAGGNVITTHDSSLSVNTGTFVSKTVTITTASNAVKIRVQMVKSISSGTASGRDYLFADNLVLNNTGSASQMPDPSYSTVSIPNPNNVAPVNYSHTGSAQTFTALVDGKYTLEVWGAQGGGSYGGQGGYSKGDLNLAQGEVLHIYVGGKGSVGSTGVYSTATGGWNGGGDSYGDLNASSGGGGTDIRKGGTSLASRIIVAGGGGGQADNDSAHMGGKGGGLTGGNGYTNDMGAQGGTQTIGGSINGALGIGGDGDSVIDSPDNGGGGGGYYGGGGGKADEGSGGGGSGYIGGLSNASTTIGGRGGDGYATISMSNIDIEQLSDPGLLGIPAEAYSLVKKTTLANAPVIIGGTSFTPGNFVNLDHEFDVYFPNKGDFAGTNEYGIASTTDSRGKGFIDDMDTTKWTKSKLIKFEFDVILNQVMYRADTWIDLPISSPNDKYTFYVPLSNSERKSSVVEFKSIAINGEEDNDNPTNKARYNEPRPHAARHSSLMRKSIDVVGKIGNFVIQDTGDYRFSNLFKTPVAPTTWFVDNVIKKVDPDNQNEIMGDLINIRGELATPANHYLDTYGFVPDYNSEPIPLPLSPEKNNIPVLRNQPMRIGYNILASIQTIGNYYDSLQIIPYYYTLDTVSKVITPVDVYMTNKGDQVPINKNGVVVPGWDPTKIFQNIFAINWEIEASRRSVTPAEMDNTDGATMAASLNTPEVAGGKTDSPYGGYYPYGTAQILYPTGRNRTYIGSSTTNRNTGAFDANPNGTVPYESYAQQAQRWQFTLGLPSSATWVKAGLPYTQKNVDDMKSNTLVLVMAVDIKAAGDTYALQYTVPGGNKPVNINGTSVPTTSIAQSVIAVYSTMKSSADDLHVSGTH